MLRRKQLAECAQHLNSRITHHLRQSQGRLQTPHPAPRQHTPRRSWTSEIRAKLAGTAMLKPQRDRRRACVIEVRCHLIVAKFCPSNPNGAKLNQKYEPTPDGLSVSAHGGLFAVLAPPSPRLVPALYCPLGALHLHRGVPWTVTSASKKPWTCTCARCASLSIRCAVVCDTPARGHVPVAELTVMTQCAVAATCMWLTCRCAQAVGRRFEIRYCCGWWRRQSHTTWPRHRCPVRGTFCCGVSCRRVCVGVCSPARWAWSLSWCLYVRVFALFACTGCTHSSR